MPATYTAEEIAQAHKVLYDEGIRMRYQVAGKEYVDNALKNADNPFSRAMQEVQPICPSSSQSSSLDSLTLISFL